MLCLLYIWLLAADIGAAVSVSMIPKSGTPPSYRELPGVTYDVINNKFYVYGGRQESLLDDMWEYDLNKNTWTEMHTTSTVGPGGRSDPHLVYLADQGKILLFGGNSRSGPTSDLWLFDI